MSCCSEGDITLGFISGDTEAPCRQLIFSVSQGCEQQRQD